MSRTARAVIHGTVCKGHQRWARRRAPDSDVRLYRASRAARIFSEIASIHITNPLPDQLELAEEDLRAALDEMMTWQSDPSSLPPLHSKRAMPGRWGNLLLGVSTCGFWTIILFNALRFLGAV